MATSNQIAYWKMMTDRDALAETSKHNRITERETSQHNRNMEAETNRSNLVKESETARSNLANELIKSNTLEETKRSNEANELIKTTANAIAKQQADVAQQNADTQSNKLLSEDLHRSLEREEERRHNRAMEQAAKDKTAADFTTGLIKGIGAIIPF